MVLDPFCGCATTCVAAQQLGRKWIGIDIETKTSEILIDRLSDDARLFKDFVHLKENASLPKRTDIKEEPVSASVKEKLFEQQEGLCGGCKEEFNIYNFEIDHIIPKSKGGGDYYENYQLLCENCNRIKGDRPMEYLRIKIKARESLLNQKFSFGG
ncbi:MAG: HNH endonuclease [Ekhidna sp.]|nr:HNH endonuclease [Ekhidna sp.]MBC6409947.1 HNH endonuclease [Ekhidna sp.]MBC6426826.1 HNH endonuclease [Ekhidna sp.]